MLIVNEVEIHLTKPKGGVIAYASIVAGGCIHLSSIAVHQKLDGSGYRLTYPTRKIGETCFNIFHPINREMSLAIEQAIFKKLKDVLSKRDDRHHCANTRISKL